MLNKVFGPVLAASMSLTPLISQAEGTKEAVAGILCTMPISCTEGSGQINSVTVHPEISRLTGTTESSLEVHASCENIGGYEQFFNVADIKNAIPSMVRKELKIWGQGPFEQGDPVPVNIEYGDLQYKKDMECSISSDLFPLEK